jgi:hypothetical protein
MRSGARAGGPRKANVSRRTALRHSLPAETVIDGLEDSEDYRGFEAAVMAL